MVRKCGSGLRANVNGRASAGGKFPVARDEIRMQMRFKDMTNLDLMIFGGIQVKVYVALWIDNDRFAF
jgi:hypothetical protein